jgi:acyl-CoA thioesterase YciA
MNVSKDEQRCPAIRVMMMPRDVNAQGTIFGGVIMSYMDQAGAIQARRHRPHRYVTVAMDQVEFKKPVYVGDVLNFNAEVTRVGRTSLTVRVRVEAERFDDPRNVVPVTEAMLTYVAVDESGQPVPVQP